MHLPLAKSELIQIVGPNVEVPATSTPRSNLQAKSMENTLNLRLFSEKKKNLFNYNVNLSKPILTKQSNSASKDSTPRPVEVVETEPLRVHDIAGRAKKIKIVNSRITEDQLFQPQQSAIKACSSPFKMSPSKQLNIYSGLAVHATNMKPAPGFFDNLSLFDASCCQPEVDNPASRKSPTFHYDTTPVKTTNPDDDAFQNQWTFANMSGDKRTPPRVKTYNFSSPGTQDQILDFVPPKDSNVIPMNNDGFDKPTYISGYELRRSLQANAQGEFVDLEYYNQKLPSTRRLEVYEGSPKRRIPPRAEHGSSARKSMVRSSSALPPSAEVRILNDLDDSHSVISSPKGRSMLKQEEMFKGESSKTPFKQEYYQHYLVAGKNSYQKTSIKQRKYEQDTKPTPKQLISEIWTKEFKKSLKPTKSLQHEFDSDPDRISRRLLKDDEDTQVSEIPPIQETMLKRSLPTEP